MFGWLKRGSALPMAAVAMIGPRQSDAVVFLGAEDPALAAETGTITRLNGRTVVVGASADDGVQTERAAVKAGAILEFVAAPLGSLPFDAATFHIAVAPDLPSWPATSRGPWLDEAFRTLQPGGRIIVLVGERRSGLLGRARHAAPGLDVVALLLARGFVAARRLADAEGVTYYEARKGREEI